MIAGFVLLGVSSIVFGAGLGRVLRPRSAGPPLIVVAGAGTIALGVFRRDHLLLTSPGFTGESWHNQVHDVVSGIVDGGSAGGVPGEVTPSSAWSAPVFRT